MKQLTKGIKNSTLILSIIYFIVLLLTAIFWLDVFLIIYAFSSIIALATIFDNDFKDDGNFPLWILPTAAGLFMFIIGGLFLLLAYIYKHSIQKLINYLDNECK